jgi:hypothetical protein
MMVGIILTIFATTSALAYWEGRRNRRTELCMSCMQRGIELGIQVAHSDTNVKATMTEDGRMRIEQETRG